MKWSLQRLKFLLGDIEDFIDTEWDEIHEKAKEFIPQTGLEAVGHLAEPSAPPEQILERLTPFFDSGLLLQDWRVTDVFWRGSVFHLDVSEQASAEHLAKVIAPTEVHRAPASKILQPLNMDFLLPSPEATGYILRPTPQLSYILFSNLAEPWAVDHMQQAHRLINKAFVY